jgi:hypoxanthine phosphoribosyltransferase
MSIETYITTEQIAQRNKELGLLITNDYEGEEIVVIGVLNGSFMFFADLVREIKVPLITDFISASSYGSGTTSSGTVNLELDVRNSIEGKNVLIVEDIVDTGNTITYLLEVIGAKGPKDIKVASLLFKPARKEKDVTVNYLGFEIEDHFVVGYGLDFDGRFRELPYIGIVKDADSI